jgi:hypothetical protein
MAGGSSKGPDGYALDRTVSRRDNLLAYMAFNETSAAPVAFNGGNSLSAHARHIQESMFVRLDEETTSTTGARFN